MVRVSLSLDDVPCGSCFLRGHREMVSLCHCEQTRGIVSRYHAYARGQKDADIATTSSHFVCAHQSMASVSPRDLR